MNTIRFAAPDDAAALLRIYAQYIETPITRSEERRVGKEC